MKNIMDMQKMIKAAREMQERLEKDMLEMRAEGSSGGGMVAVTVDGRKNVLGLKIDPEVVNREDVEMLQDLVMAALNDAAKKVDQALAEKLGGLGAGLKFPGVF
jgi:hypothetical protein